MLIMITPAPANWKPPSLLPGAAERGAAGDADRVDRAADRRRAELDLASAAVRSLSVTVTGTCWSMLLTAIEMPIARCVLLLLGLFASLDGLRTPSASAPTPVSIVLVS